MNGDFFFFYLCQTIVSHIWCCTTLKNVWLNFGGLKSVKLKIEFLPQGDHTVSSTKTSQSVLFSEIVTMFLRIYTTQINTLCIQNAEFLEV